MHYQILAQHLKTLGASPAQPPRLSRSLRSGMQIDAEIAQTSACEACGHARLTYEAWHQGRLYFAAVARCPQCNESFEF